MLYFFIHLSVDVHLGCFHLLAVVNNAARIIGTQASLELLFLLSVGIAQAALLETVISGSSRVPGLLPDAWLLQSMGPSG